MEGDVLAGEVAADFDDGIGGVEVLMGGAGERKTGGIGDEESSSASWAVTHSSPSSRGVLRKGFLW